VNRANLQRCNGSRLKEFRRPRIQINAEAIWESIAAFSNRSDKHIRQQTFIRAIETFIPELDVYYGRFLGNRKKLPIARPTGTERFAEVIWTEEKGSDVNLGVHFVYDACEGLYDCGVVISNDGDLAEALRIVKDELGKLVGVTHPTFEHLLRIEDGLLEKTTEDMRANGYSPSKPVTLAVWEGQDEPVLVDGHMRRQAAINEGITEVPYVIEEFPDQAAVLQYAINCQTKRRVTTDGALYRLCEQFDRLMKCGGDRKSEDAKSRMQRCKLDRGRKSEESKELMTGVINYRGPSASAKKTAHLIGCHYRKVDKIRRIRKDGWLEIQQAVRNDEITINKAYDLIRKTEIGEDDEKSARKLTVGQIKMLKTVCGEEIITELEGYSDDLRSYLVAAMKQYLHGLRENGRDEDSAHSNTFPNLAQPSAATQRRSTADDTDE
jgi:hypothetical protein